jgi:hypothetical protein
MGNGYGTKVLSCPTPQPPSATAARVAGNPVAMESVAEGWTPSPMALSCTSASGRVAPEQHVDRDLQIKTCSFGLSPTSQQYFSLTTNQPPATSQQYFSLGTNQHQPSATSQTNRLYHTKKTI